jgi:hypothetical protein
MTDKENTIQQEQDGTFSCRLCGKKGFATEFAAYGHLGICPARTQTQIPNQPPITSGNHEARISALEQAVVNLTTLQQRILQIVEQITQNYQLHQKLLAANTVLGNEPEGLLKEIIYKIAKTIMKKIEQERKRKKKKELPRA